MRGPFAPPPSARELRRMKKRDESRGIKPRSDRDEAPPPRINPGDRVAQASLVPAPRVTFTVVEQMSLTERGAGGFGSTGL